jgi:hypothetical protein
MLTQVFGGVGLSAMACGFWGGSTPSFSFGQGGDAPVYIGAKGLGSASNRQNMVYGVYRAGTWFLDESGSGAPTLTINFGVPDSGCTALETALEWQWKLLARHLS